MKGPFANSSGNKQGVGGCRNIRSQLITDAGIHCRSETAQWESQTPSMWMRRSACSARALCSTPAPRTAWPRYGPEIACFILSLGEGGGNGSGAEHIRLPPSSCAMMREICTRSARSTENTWHRKMYPSRRQRVCRDKKLELSAGGACQHLGL